MKDVIQLINSPEDLFTAAKRLRRTVDRVQLTPEMVLDAFEAWADALSAPDLKDIPGVAFLRLWLRRGTLEPIILRELGHGALEGRWMKDGRAKIRAFPVGVVGHWPAGNIEIQPVLSMTCALLGGNASLVRVPESLVSETRALIAAMERSGRAEILRDRVFMAVFDHSRMDLQQAMAQAVDGAMIWGGQEAVSKLRALPFPHWARVSVFGPRISVAAMDSGAWCDPHQRDLWCQRIARDTWQFDQQACSSPQVLFLERRQGSKPFEFLQMLSRAFEEENRRHPRLAIHPALTSAICQARASWLLDDFARRAIFPTRPDWTLLLGTGSDIPNPVQGRTLMVLETDDLIGPVSRLDGNVQTLGLGMSDPGKEEKLASLAARRGVDRIVKLGRMHVFTSPWDGADLIRPMVRLVRYVPSTQPREQVQ